MNGLEDDGVASTIHITPEDHCSYASLEISGPKQAGGMAVHASDPSSAIRGAASIFRPKHMAVAVSWTGDAHSSLADEVSLPQGTGFSLALRDREQSAYNLSSCADLPCYT